MKGITGIVLLLSLLAPLHAENLFGCIIDAGGSGSRIRVYTWPPKKLSNQLPRMTEVGNLKISPGVATHVDDMEGLKQYLEQLIAKAKELVPADKHSSTPIYFFATAGMRLLEEDRMRSLMDNIAANLFDQNLSPFKFVRQNARVLSGEEEGAYAWIAVNYLSGALTNSSVEKRGIVEMGSTSLQIAFLSEYSILDDRYPLRLAGSDYSLYVHSFLKYGDSKMTQWIHELLQKSNPSSGTYNDPCMLKGDVQNLTMNGEQVSFHGSGNFSECSELLDHYISDVPNEFCSPKPCSIGTAYQPSPNPDMKFYALSAIYHTARSIKAVDEQGRFSTNGFQEAARRYCLMGLDEAEEFSGTPRKYLSGICMKGAFVPKLMKAFHLPSDKPIFTAISEIGGQKYAWTLGALISETEKQPIMIKRSH